MTPDRFSDARLRPSALAGCVFATVLVATIGLLAVGLTFYAAALGAGAALRALGLVQ